MTPKLVTPTREDRERAAATLLRLDVALDWQLAELEQWYDTGQFPAHNSAVYSQQLRLTGVAQAIAEAREEGRPDLRDLGNDELACSVCAKTATTRHSHSECFAEGLLLGAAWALIDWQSIETAPKDQRVMLWLPDEGPVFGRWTDAPTSHPQPTHWAPLPEGPK